MLEKFTTFLLGIMSSLSFCFGVRPYAYGNGFLSMMSKSMGFIWVTSAAVLAMLGLKELSKKKPIQDLQN